MIFDKIFVIRDGLLGWNERDRRWPDIRDSLVLCADVFYAMARLLKNDKTKKACVLADASQFQTLNGKALLEFCLASNIKCAAVSKEKKQIAGVDIYRCIDDFFEKEKPKHDAVELDSFRVTTEEINALLES